MDTVTLKIIGMDCAEEIATLKAQLQPRQGVGDLSFNLLDGTMTVAYDPAVLTVERLVASVGRTGMNAQPVTEAAEQDLRGAWWNRWSRTILTAGSGGLGAAAFVTYGVLAGWRAAIGGDEAIAMPWLVRAIYLFATAAGVWQVLPKAWASIRRLRPDMNLLMVVAVVGAMGIGQYAEAATVAFLFSLSLALEAWSVGRARRAVAALMALSPPEARVIDPDGNERMAPVEDVQVGGRFIVKPGERVPLDGRIEKGETTVNQAPITGESMPVSKEVGDELFAGSVNEDGAVEVVAVKPAGQSMVSQIIKLVAEAQSNRSPSEQWVETFARYYTPTVMVVAVIVAVGFPLVMGDWSKWFYSALVLLVIACPCALVISTPVSIVAALAAAARQGVLIKGGLYIELPARLRAIATDKTGTLTEGKPQVTNLVPLSGHSGEELLRIAAAIELRSEHPLARAIVTHAESQGLRPAPVEDYQTIKGKGATAKLDGKAVWVGSHRYLEERGHENPEMHQTMEGLAAGGSSVVVVGEADNVCGFIALADRVRPESRQAVADLKTLGVERVVMLTGDNRATATAIASWTGVDEFRAEMLPQDKIAAIEELVTKYAHVAMIGDGVNDAPAMARASLGIAMGAAGTDAAIEAADIALMSDDLSRLPWLIGHARRTLRIIRQNIIASLAVKAVFVVLTFLGHASLWGAIAADTGVSLAVVFNALRLLRSSTPAQETAHKRGTQHA